MEGSGMSHPQGQAGGGGPVTPIMTPLTGRDQGGGWETGTIALRVSECLWAYMLKLACQSGISIPSSAAGWLLNFDISITGPHLLKHIVLVQAGRLCARLLPQAR
eukprot:scaffold211319_cov45-Prasinocladus_malaysianus.AAC.1